MVSKCNRHPTVNVSQQRTDDCESTEMNMWLAAIYRHCMENRRVDVLESPPQSSTSNSVAMMLLIINSIAKLRPVARESLTPPPHTKHSRSLALESRIVSLFGLRSVRPSFATLISVRASDSSGSEPSAEAACVD